MPPQPLRWIVSAGATGRSGEARRLASPDRVVVRGTVAQVQLEVGQASECN
jgi:hypothetical protein